MKNYQCPRCEQESIPFKDKYRAGLWGNIHCVNCGSRLCANPILMAVLYAAHTWNVLWWFALFYWTGHYYHLIFMLLVWVVIDFINVHYIPLSVMKPGKKPST